MNKLEMYRGDDREFTFTLTEDGGPMDLTGASLRFTAKRAASDADLVAVITKTTASGIVTDADPTTGIAVATVAMADTTALNRTTTLVWDLQVTRGGRTRTVLTGTLLVRIDTSHTAP